jgi:hypothetical protein
MQLLKSLYFNFLKMCVGKKKKRKKMINNGTIIRSTAIAANVYGFAMVGFQGTNVQPTTKLK